MKSLKLISSALTMLICFVTMAQDRTNAEKHLKNDSIAIQIPAKILVKSRDTIPNVTVSPNFGQPGTPIKHIIICAPSRSLLKEPMYILDGITINSKQFSKINPNDIEEIKVLKGNDATSLYGNEAINGVIVITTKEKE